MVHVYVYIHVYFRQYCSQSDDELSQITIGFLTRRRTSESLPATQRDEIGSAHRSSESARQEPTSLDRPRPRSMHNRVRNNKTGD